MRPIDADALLQRWNDVVPRMVRDKDGGISIDFCLVIHEVSATPTLTLDDLRPKGRWVDGECTNCGCDALYNKGVPAPTYTEFCPSCGADMRGGGEDG